MKKILAAVMVLAMIFALAACGQTAAPAPAAPAAPAADAPAADAQKSAAFVTIGLNNPFFQTLADSFVSEFEAMGWTAEYADGNFNPDTQIAAVENYIAKGVDVLFIWAVAPEAMTNAVQTAQAQGIKVVSFVQVIEGSDAIMVSEEKDLADDLCRLAAKWVDEAYADAEDHSVPVAAFTCRKAPSGVTQGDEMLKFAEFSVKAGEVLEIELEDETNDIGQTAMENLYLQHPEIKVFITPHNGLGMGINTYFTSLSSPVTDYSDMGIFVINGADDVAEVIKTSAEGKSPLRGNVMTGSAEDTAVEMAFVGAGILDGSLPAGHVQKAGTVFVFCGEDGQLVNAKTLD